MENEYLECGVRKKRNVMRSMENEECGKRGVWNVNYCFDMFLFPMYFNLFLTYKKC